MKNKINHFTLIALSGLMVLALASITWASYGYSSNTTTGNATVITNKEVTIAIKGFTFNPENVTVKPGTKVTWVNNDSVTHNIAIDQVNVTSPDLGKDGKWSYTFNKTGTFSYYCAFHSGMKGTVTVKK